MADGRKIPYWIEVGIQDDKLRQQMSKWNWKEIMGVDDLGDVFKSGAEEAKNGFMKAINSMDVDWEKVLNSKAFKRVLDGIVKDTNDSMRSKASKLGESELKAVTEFVTEIGRAMKEVDASLDTKGFVRSMVAFANSIQSVSGDITKLTEVFGFLADKIDQIKDTKSIGSFGFTDGLKKVQKFEKEVSELNALLKEVSNKSVDIKFNKDLKRQFNGLKKEIVSFENDVQILEDKLKDTDLTPDEKDRLSAELAESRLILANHYRKMEKVNDEYLKRNAGQQSLFTNNDAQAAIDAAEKYAIGVIKNLKKVEEVLGESENAIHYEIALPTLGDIKKKLNETIRQVNKPGTLDKIKVELDTSTDMSDVDILGTKKANEDAKILEKEFEANAKKLKELYREQKALEDEQDTKKGGVFSSVRAHRIEEIKKETDRLIRLQQGLNKVSGGFGAHTIASLVKALNSIDAVVDEKTNSWRSKIVKAFQPDKGEIKILLNSEESAKVIFNEVQDYFTANEIELHLNKEAFIQEVKEAIDKGGLQVGGTAGSTVSFEPKDMAMAIATGLQAFFTGDYTSVAGEKQTVKEVQEPKKTHTYFDPSNPFNRDVANSLREVLKAGLDVGDKKGNKDIKAFFNAEGVNVAEMANASAGELLELLDVLTDQYGSTVADRFKQLMNSMGKNAAASKVGNFIGDFREMLYTNRISQVTVDEDIKRDKQRGMWEKYVEKSVLDSGLGQLIGLTNGKLDISKLKRIPTVEDIGEYIGVAEKYANKSGLDSLDQQIEDTRAKIATAEKEGKEQEAASLNRQLGRLQARRREIQDVFDFYTPIVEMLKTIQKERDKLQDITNDSQKREFVNAVKKFQSTIGDFRKELAEELGDQSWGIQLEGEEAIREINSTGDASKLYKGALGRDNKKIKNTYLYSGSVQKEFLDPRPDKTALRNMDASIPEFVLREDTNKRWEAENKAAIEASERATESNKLVAETEKRLADGDKAESAIEKQISELTKQRKINRKALEAGEKELASITRKKSAQNAKERVAKLDEELEIARREKELAERQAEDYKNVDFSARDAEEKAIDSEIRQMKKWIKNPEKYSDEIDALFEQEVTEARKRYEEAAQFEALAQRGEKGKKAKFQQDIDLARQAVERAKEYSIDQDIEELNTLQQELSALSEQQQKTDAQLEREKHLRSQIKLRQDRIMLARERGGNPYLADAEASLQMALETSENYKKQVQTARDATDKAEKDLYELMDLAYPDEFNPDDPNASNATENRRAKIEEFIRNKQAAKSYLAPNLQKEGEERAAKADKEIAKLEAQRQKVVDSQDYKNAERIAKLEADNEELRNKITTSETDLAKAQEQQANLAPEKTTQELLDAHQENIDGMFNDLGKLQDDLKQTKEEAARVEAYVNDVVNDKDYKKPGGTVGHTKKNQKVVSKYYEEAQKAKYAQNLVSGKDTIEDEIRHLSAQNKGLEESKTKGEKSATVLKDIQTEIDRNKQRIAQLQRQQDTMWTDAEKDAIATIKDDNAILGYVNQLESLFKNEETGIYRDPYEIHKEISALFDSIRVRNEEQQRRAESEGATEQDRRRAEMYQTLTDTVDEFIGSYVETGVLEGGEEGDIKIGGEAFESMFKEQFAEYRHSINRDIAEQAKPLKAHADVVNNLQPEFEAAQQHLKETYVKKVKSWFNQVRDRQKIVAKGQADGADEAAKNAAGLAVREISTLFPLIATTIEQYKSRFGEELTLAEKDAELLTKRSEYNYRSHIDGKTEKVRNDIASNKQTMLSSERETLLKTRRGELLRDIKKATAEKKSTTKLEKSLKVINDELSKYQKYTQILAGDATTSIFYEDEEFASKYSVKLEEIIKQENELDLAQAKGASQADIDAKHTSINATKLDVENILRERLKNKQTSLTADIEANRKEGKAVGALVEQLNLVNKELVELEVNHDIRKQTALGGNLYKSSEASVRSYTDAIRAAIIAKQELDKLSVTGEDTKKAAKDAKKADTNVKEAVNRAIDERLNGPANTDPRAQALDYIDSTEEQVKLARQIKEDAERRLKQADRELEALRTDTNYPTSNQYKNHYNALKREATNAYVRSDDYQNQRSTGVQNARSAMEEYLREALRPAAENAMKAAQAGVEVEGAVEPKTVQEVHDIFRDIIAGISENSNLGDVKRQLIGVAKNYSANGDEQRDLISAINTAVADIRPDDVNVETVLAQITEPLKAADSAEIRGGVEKLLEQNVQKTLYLLMESTSKHGSKFDPKKFAETVALGSQGGWGGIETYFEKDAAENSEEYKNLVAQRDSTRKESFDAKLAELEEQRKTIGQEYANAVSEIISESDKEFEKISKQFKKILSRVKKTSNMKDVKKQLINVAKDTKLTKDTRDKLYTLIEDTLTDRPYDKADLQSFMAYIPELQSNERQIKIDRQASKYQKKRDNIGNRRHFFEERFNAGEWRADADTEKDFDKKIQIAIARYIESQINTEKFDTQKLEEFLSGDIAKELGLSEDIVNTFKSIMEENVYNLVKDHAESLTVKDGSLIMPKWFNVELTDEEKLDKNGKELSKAKQEELLEAKKRKKLEEELIVLDEAGNIDVMRTTEKRLEARRKVAEADLVKAEAVIAENERKRRDAMAKGGLSKEDKRDAKTKQELAEFEAKLNAEKVRQIELEEELLRLNQEGASAGERAAIVGQLAKSNKEIDRLEKFVNNRELLIEMNRKIAEDEQKRHEYTLDEQKLFYESKRATAEKLLGSDDEKVREKATADITRYNDILGRIEAKMEEVVAQEREKNDPTNIIANKFADAIKKSLGGNGGLNVDATGLASEATLAEILAVLTGGKVAKSSAQSEVAATITKKSPEWKAIQDEAKKAYQKKSEEGKKWTAKDRKEIDASIKDLIAKIQDPKTDEKNKIALQVALKDALSDFSAANKNSKKLNYKTGKKGNEWLPDAEIEKYFGLTKGSLTKLKPTDTQARSKLSGEPTKAESKTVVGGNGGINVLAKENTLSKILEVLNFFKTNGVKGAGSKGSGKNPEPKPKEKTEADLISERALKQEAVVRGFAAGRGETTENGSRLFAQYEAEVKALKDAVKAANKATKTKKAQLLDAVKVAAARVDALTRNILVDTAEWEYVTAQSDKVIDVGNEKMDQTKMEKIAKDSIDPNKEQYKFLGFDGETLTYQLTDVEGHIRKVTMVWSEFNKQVAITSDKTSGTLDEAVSKLDDMNRAFEDAQQVGYLSKKDEDLKKFNAQQKKIKKLIESGASIDKVETARIKGVALGDIVSAKVRKNKQAYTGLNEIGSVESQRNNIFGTFDEALINGTEKVKEYNEAYAALLAKFNEYKTKGTLYDPANQEELRRQAIGVKHLGQELQKTLKDAAQWEQIISGASYVNADGLNEGEKMTREGMEKFALDSIDPNKEKYKFMGFDGKNLTYQLTDVEGNIRNVTMAWNDYYHQVAIVSDQTSSKIDKIVSKLGTFEQKFKSAVDMGYLAENDEELKKFEEQMKAIQQAILDNKSFDEIESMRQNALNLASGVSQKVTKNRRLYSGVGDINAAKKQKMQLEASFANEDGKFDTDSSAVKNYIEAYNALLAKYEELRKANQLYSDESQRELSKQATKVKTLGKELGASLREVDELERLVEQSGSYRGHSMGKTQTVTAEETRDLEGAMRSLLQSMELGNIEHIKFDHTSQKLTGTLRTSNKTVADLEVKYNEATGALYAYQKAERESLTGLPAFLNGFKKKFNSIMQYLTMTMSIHRVLAELRRGIQYIREIDLALTELRKVTDETKETYDEFLKTAAKTGERLGTTISAVTEATATFAKLGYTMEQATEMAEAAIVYKNVGDNIASTSDAADSIISTMKGFKLEATESMAIVDRFNEVGNRFAITSQGIGEALRLSASALSEGGNSLDESIGLITAANEVVNDPSSVGTALKTLTLRLRGSKTELEEMGEDVSDMATTTSQLQAKLLALTGGQVDIMLDEN